MSRVAITGDPITIASSGDLVDHTIENISCTMKPCVFFTTMYLLHHSLFSSFLFIDIYPLWSTVSLYILLAVVPFFHIFYLSSPAMLLALELAQQCLCALVELNHSVHKTIFQMVLHLVSEEVYITLRFIQTSPGNNFTNFRLYFIYFDTHPVMYAYPPCSDFIFIDLFSMID